MTIEQHAIARTALLKETAFATDETATGTYLDLPVIENSGQLTLIKDELAVDIQQQHLYGRALAVLGKKSATYTFQVPCYGYGTAAGDGVDSAAEDANALLQLLAVVFGGIDAENTGSDVSSAASSTSITPTSATDFLEGVPIGWANSSGNVEARVIRNEVAGVVTVKSAFSATPSSSDVLYAGTTIYPTQDPQDTIQMIVEGAEQSDRWLLMGGQLSAAPQLTRANGEVPMWTFTLTFADWAKEPDAAITTASYSNYSPTYVHGDFAMKVSGSGVTTHTQYDAASVTYTFNGPIFQPVSSPNGTNTIARWRAQRVKPLVQVSVSLPYEAYTWFTERDDRDSYTIHDQIGLTAGSIVLLETSTAQVQNPQRTNQDGLAYQTIEFHAGLDDTVNGTNDLAVAPFRMHFL